MPTPFRLLLRVRYMECDPQGVVFNARYGDYLDLALTELLRVLGYGAAAAAGELDYHLVKQTLEWRRPARFDDVLEIALFARHLGNTSFTLAAEFRLNGEQAVLAAGETVYVLMDPQTHAKRSLPADFRAALEQGAAGAVVNQAGVING